MKKKSKMLIARDAFELADELGLTPSDAVEIEVRSALNDKIVEIVKKHGLTHAQVAKVAETSRTRVTAILNRNTQDVSTDLLLRILARLGYRAKISFSRAA
ncbi:MAG: XRE family transcriptional regulator [Deltaproteobacteria bacterium]|nr:XRE family transcriptional regulator [Deltaproteobacteria bacterium]